MQSPRMLLLALSLAGCASSGDDPSDDSAGPGARDTHVYESCVEFATRLCRDAEGCCRTVYDDFELESCVTSFEREVCRPGADAVAANRATFDEAAVDDCLAAHSEAHAVCVPTWQQTLGLRKRLYSACRVIDGTSPPGAGCSITATCKHPAGNAGVDCVKNVCQEIAVLGEGEHCPFPSGSVSVCDEGLTCDAPGLGATGRCVEAPRTDEACAGSSLESTACGLGSYCEAGSNTCKVAKNFGGTGCSQGTECVSFECDRVRNECAPAPAVVSRRTCLGVSPPP